MEPILPKLRSDLLISQQEASGEASVVVKDPLTRRFFRLRAVDYAVARRLDGATPLETVARDIQPELDVAADTKTVAEFVEQLRRLGLLQTDQSASDQHRPIRQRVAGSLLYLRLKAFDPDRLLTRLLPAVRFCFTRPFLGLTGLLILLALGVSLDGWSALGREFTRLYRWETLLLAWFAILGVTTAHEFAHGLTCKHFGGEVHEMGFLLLYFQPAFYCNVSDAWLFPKKAQRLWVTAAGAYCEMVLWALATLTWRVTEPDTGVHFVALVVMATSWFKTVFNLNPLIKLDGYYLLSDALEIPNLRQRAFRYLGAQVQRWWGGVSPPGVPEATPRERRIYWCYGLLAGGYSYWLLGLVALYFGRFLVERYQGVGFLLFTGLLVAVFQQPLGTALRKITQKLRPALSPSNGRSHPPAPAGREVASTSEPIPPSPPLTEIPPPPPLDKGGNGGILVNGGGGGTLPKGGTPSGNGTASPQGQGDFAWVTAILNRIRPALGRMAAMKRPAKGVLLVTALLPMLFLGRMGLKVSGEFTVLPIRHAEVRAEVEGLIQEIAVEEGDRVQAGDLIARLSDRDFSTELRQLGAQLAEKRAKLKLLVAGPRAEEIALARQAVETARTRQEAARKRLAEGRRMRTQRLARTQSSVAKAEERLKYAKNYLTIYQDLFHDGAVSRKQIDEAAEEVAVRAKGLEETRADLNLVRADDLSEPQKELAVAGKELEEAKGKLQVLLAGSRPEEIEASEAEIARLEAQRRYQEEQLQRVRVVSPLAGIITTPKPKDKVGQWVKKGDLLVEVQALKTITAEIAVSEKDVGEVQVGQAVVLKARAYPERRFLGAVTAIAPAAVKDAEEAWRGKIFKVTADIDNPALLLKSEMTGNAKISAGKRRIFDLVTRRLARYVRVEFWSWW